jgi:hypothetical protein
MRIEICFCVLFALNKDHRIRDSAQPELDAWQDRNFFRKEFTQQ